MDTRKTAEHNGPARCSDEQPTEPDSSTSWCPSSETWHTTDEQKIQKALDLIYSYYVVDGWHHKNWVVDQVVWALLDDPRNYAAFVSEGEYDTNQWRDMVENNCIPP